MGLDQDAVGYMKGRAEGRSRRVCSRGGGGSAGGGGGALGDD